MKKSLCFIFIVLGLVACTNTNNQNVPDRATTDRNISANDGSPKQVAKAFIKNLVDANPQEAKKYCTVSTGKYVPTLIAGASMNPICRSKIIRDSIVGADAWVFCQVENHRTPMSIRLFKIEGQWKVDLH